MQVYTTCWMQPPEALLDALTDLGLEGIAEADLCSVLQKHIIAVEGAGGLARDAESVQEWVKARGCPFPDPNWQQLASFLVCELQLCRIRASKAFTVGAQQLLTNYSSDLSGGSNRSITISRPVRGQGQQGRGAARVCSAQVRAASYESIVQ